MRACCNLLLSTDEHVEKPRMTRSKKQSSINRYHRRMFPFFVVLLFASDHPFASVDSIVAASAAPVATRNNKKSFHIISRRGRQNDIDTKEDQRQQPTSGQSLDFWGAMICGSVARSIAKTLLHPANTAKTIAQTQRHSKSVLSSTSCSSIGAKRVAEAALDGTYAGIGTTNAATVPLPPPPTGISSSAPNTISLRTLFRGAGAQFILSAFLGAANFAILEQTRKVLDSDIVQSHLPQKLRGQGSMIGTAGKDFTASCVSTTVCSVFSIPHMVIMDNIMAGTEGFSTLPAAIRTLSNRGGPKSFYHGGWAHIGGKVPAYAISWSCFQHLKRTHANVFHRSSNNKENMLMGSIASGVSVLVMIPYETVKTRLVTQATGSGGAAVPYRGIYNGLTRIIREEGPLTLFSGLRPRLASVVPMLAIQLAVYEACKKEYLSIQVAARSNKK